MKMNRDHLSEIIDSKFNRFCKTDSKLPFREHLPEVIDSNYIVLEICCTFAPCGVESFMNLVTSL